MHKRNNCCEFLASNGVIFQSVIESFFRTSVFATPLSFFKFNSVSKFTFKVFKSISCALLSKYVFTYCTSYEELYV